VAELEGFAGGLNKDYEAVKAALNYEWSSGQVEGQIIRLKFIKRQMYGGANFDLLRLASCTQPEMIMAEMIIGRQNDVPASDSSMLRQSQKLGYGQMGLTYVAE